MWPEVLHQARAQRLIHLRVARVVELFVFLLLRLKFCDRQVEKCIDLFERGCRISIEVLTFEDQKLLTGEEAHPGLQLIHIYSSGQITMMLVGIALIMFILENLLTLLRCALLFVADRLFEGSAFVSQFDTMIV